MKAMAFMKSNVVMQATGRVKSTGTMQAIKETKSRRKLQATDTMEPTRVLRVNRRANSKEPVRAAIAGPFKGAAGKEGV